MNVAGLHMRYGTNHVIRGVDLRIEPGEVVALLGPNGAGKTTTIEILEGFRTPSAGTVRVLGQDPAHAGERWRARVGVVLQSWRDHGRWRVADLLHHLGQFYWPYATPERPRPWPTAELLARVGLADEAGRPIRELSGGQRRRLDVAIGIVGRPELVFLDEPTAGFDPVARRAFHDLIADLADDDVTILLTTHDLDEAEKVADRIVVLAGGGIVADGSPDSLRLRAAGPSEIRWVRDGATFVHATREPADYLRDLLTTPGGAITDLEVRRATLEEAYLQLVRRTEQGERPELPDLLTRDDAPTENALAGSARRGAR